MKRFLVGVLSVTMLASLTASSQTSNVPEYIEIKTETINSLLQFLSNDVVYAKAAPHIHKIQQESTEYIKRLNDREEAMKAKEKKKEEK